MWVGARGRWGGSNGEGGGGALVGLESSDVGEGSSSRGGVGGVEGVLAWRPITLYRSVGLLQTCTLRFSSWYHPVSQLLLTSEKRDMDQSQYEEDGEWELQRTDVIVTSHTYFVDPFKENAVNFSEVSFS